MSQLVVSLFVPSSRTVVDEVAYSRIWL